MAVSDWFAWVNLQPTTPRSLHVQGTTEAPTPAYYAMLKVANPQGTNHTILLMDLVLHKLPIDATQVVTEIPVIYLDRKYDGDHKQVSIRKAGEIIATVDIHEVR